MMTAGVAQRGLSIVALTTLLTGRMVGPDYRRPLTPPPAQYRFALGDVRDPASIADIAWVDLFQDDALRELIRTVLVQNDDVQIAAASIRQHRVLSASRPRPPARDFPPPAGATDDNLGDTDTWVSSTARLRS